MEAYCRSIHTPAIALVLTISAAHALVLPADGADSGKLAILTRSGVPAYRSAVGGIQEELLRTTGQLAEVFELAADRDDPALERLRSANPAMVISVGVRATTAAAALGVPHIATMLLDQEARQIEPPGARLASVTLDVTPRAALMQVRRAFPGCRRVAVVRGPKHADSSMEEISTQATALGFTVLPISCDGPKSFLEALPKLRGRADLVWCLPNQELYDAAAVQAFILSSIRFRVPLIGFSEAFLRAGALIGLMPDYHDVGRQSAELVRQCRGGGRPPLRQVARIVRSMVNERAGRAMGIDLSGIPADVERIR